MKIKCIIHRYDPAVKKAPFKFIELYEFVMEDIDATDGGVKLYSALFQECSKRALSLQFYSRSSKEGVTYELVVK